jgi:predicted lipoprotein
MAVGSVSPNNSYIQSAQTGQTSAFKQRRQDFEALAQALNSGDLSGAKSAFSALQQDFKTVVQTQPGQQTPGNGQNSFQAAFQVLGQALSSGDLSAARNAFASLQQAHGHHHRHAQTNGGTSAPATSTGASTLSSISIKT